MREEFEKLVAMGKINRQDIDPLLNLAQSGYCMHRSWGFGKITTIDTISSRFTIDFESKPGHSMDLSFGVQSLTAIPKDHILARKYSDLNGLKQLAAVNHLELIKIILQSYEGKASIGQIQQILVPDIITDDWKKWWELARKELKKDGHFRVPIKKSDPIVYQDKVVTLQDELLQEFRAAKGLKARLTVVNEMIKSTGDFEDAKAVAEEVTTKLNTEITSHLANKQALALEAIFARNDLLEACEATLPPDSVQQEAVWNQEIPIVDVLSKVSASRQKKTLSSLKECRPETWATGLLDVINHVPAKLCGECANLLSTENHLDILKLTVGRLVNQHQASCELLLWLAKDRSDTYADILGPEVFRAMLTAIDRDQFNEKKSNKLANYIIDDKTLIIDLINAADIEVIKDLTRALKFSGVFDDMDKRSLLARIVKAYPSIQSLISGEQSRQEDTGLVVSWESLERRREEYQNLVQKKIPDNSKEIAIARSYGDLRENHEYKAAKEMQKLLMGRKHELETDLTRARGTDFAGVRTDVVGIGTIVELSDLDSNTEETYSILGAWDSDPEKGVISYQSPLAQVLLNKPVGVEIEMDLGHETKHYRIVSIRNFNTGPATAKPVDAPVEDAVKTE